MEKSVRTVIGAKLQTAQKLNRPYTYSPNSVVNDQLGIFAGERPTVTPWTQYMIIGIGGLSATPIGPNKRLELRPIPHSPRDTGMYEQTPFVIRPIGEDLTVAERAKFRLRKVEPVKGVMSAIYWGRKLDLRNTEVRMEYRTVEDNVVTSTPFEPDASDQYPTPVIVNPGQVLVTGDDYVASTAKNTVQFDPWDINELINVGNILYDSEIAITISELALCAGIDANVRGDFNGISLEYIDAIGVQITDFVSTLIPVAYNRAGASVNLDVGSTEPLYALKNSTTITTL